MWFLSVSLLLSLLPGLVALTLPWNLLEMQNLRCHARYTASKSAFQQYPLNFTALQCPPSPCSPPMLGLSWSPGHLHWSTGEDCLLPLHPELRL